MMLCLHQIVLEGLEKIFSIYNKIITIDDQIRNEKLQHDIHREATKISGLSSKKKLVSMNILQEKNLISSNQNTI